MISLSLSVIQMEPSLFQRHETERETELSSSRKLGGEFIKKKCEGGKSRLFLVFLQVVLSALLVWLNTCGSTTLHIGLFSGTEGWLLTSGSQ